MDPYLCPDNISCWDFYFNDNRVSDYRKFRKFLREQGCEEAFDSAFYHYNDYTLFDESLWEVGDAIYIFGHSFDWGKTPQGRNYWLEIDKKWNNKNK